MIVDLDAFPDLGLIVKAPTGVQYTSQVAGFACEHPVAEGFLVPLRTRVGRPELATLWGLFRGAWTSLDEEQAGRLDRALRKHGFTSISVDRTLLSESKEAWVHVVLSEVEIESVPLKIDPGQAALGILVWPNSD